MFKLLNKEIKLSSSKLTYWFILFGLLTFCPGYPILVGTFFVTLGIFQSFQYSREANDIAYSLLLPVSRADTVKSKYIFCVFIEACAFLINTVIAFFRMTVLASAPLYVNNALMNANLSYLGFVLLIFGLFNSVFVCGFYKTAYYFSKPFIKYCIITFFTVAVAEALHFIPGLEAVNVFGFNTVSLIIFVLGLISYTALTYLSFKLSVRRFKKADL